MNTEGAIFVFVLCLVSFFVGSVIGLQVKESVLDRESVCEYYINAERVRAFRCPVSCENPVWP